MSGEIFCAGMHDQVDTPIGRALVDGCGKSAVDKSDEIVLPGQRYDLLQINHAQRGVCWRFQVEQLRIGLDGARMLIVFRGIYKCGFDAEFGEPLAEELCGSAINVALSDDMVATFQQREKRRSNGAHAGSEEQR